MKHLTFNKFKVILVVFFRVPEKNQVTKTSQDDTPGAKSEPFTGSYWEKKYNKFYVQNKPLFYFIPFVNVGQIQKLYFSEK